MFYKYAADITYITESRRKKNKQARSFVRSKRKKGKGFWHYSGISVLLFLSDYHERVSD